MLAALGFTATLEVPLSNDGGATVTHYATHNASSDAFTAIITGQVIPPIEGYSEAEIEAMLSQLIVSVHTPAQSWGREHLQEVMSARGLVEPE